MDEKESMEYLKKTGFREEDAKEIYNIFGGRIQELQQAKSSYDDGGLDCKSPEQYKARHLHL